MIQIIKDESYSIRGIPFGIAEVRYPEREKWNVKAFYELVKKELSDRRLSFPDYDRKTVFGSDPYFRFFKKFKKTYPVMLQAESVLFKDRPFPEVNPVTEVPFLFEICTFMLSGTHDIDRMDGPLTLFSPNEKLPFMGLRGEEIHTYPNDVCGHDDKGIILSMIAGADARTCARMESCHVFYPVFGTMDISSEQIKSALGRIRSYVSVLSPEAEVETAVI